MISLLEIARSINEVEIDDEEIIKYKDKDGESAEMKAGSAKTMEKEHPAKIAYDKMAADDSGEKDSGDKLGGGDFDRDSNKAGDDDADDADAEDKVDAKEFEEDGAVDVALSDESLVRGEREPETPAEVAAMAIVKDAIENDIITSEPNSTDIFYNIQDKIRNGEYERQDAVDSLKGGKDESITINGKQYSPIKESKKKPNSRILKENYDRIFRSRK